MFDDVLYRFYVPQIVMGIDVDADPHLVRKAFLNVIQKLILSEISVFKELGETKVEITVVFA